MKIGCMFGLLTGSKDREFLLSGLSFLACKMGIIIIVSTS